MEKPDKNSVYYCDINAKALGPFQPYLLPHIANQAAWHPQRFLLTGAAWNGYGIGAAAVSKDPENPEEAVLQSLFVDPQARGRGVGTQLLRLCAEKAWRAGAKGLRLSYCMPGPELDAMDRAVRALGGEPVFHASVYTVDSAKFHDSPVFGWTLKPSFRPAPNVVLFRDLAREQIERLNGNGEIPENLRPAARKDLYDPSLSLAWVENDEVLSYLLVCRSVPGSYAGLSAWRSGRAPGDAYVHLLAAAANLCYYHGGGDFLFHLSPISEHTEAMVRAYAGDLCVKMEEHTAWLSLPVEE